MRHLAVKAFLGVVVLGLLPSFAYADHRGSWHGGFHDGFRGHSRFSLSLGFGFGGFYGGYGPSYYYPRSYCYDYYPSYSYRTYIYDRPPVYYAPACRSYD